MFVPPVEAAYPRMLYRLGGEHVLAAGGPGFALLTVDDAAAEAARLDEGWRRTPKDAEAVAAAEADEATTPATPPRRGRPPP